MYILQIEYFIAAGVFIYVSILVCNLKICYHICVNYDQTTGLSLSIQNIYYTTFGRE